MTHYTDVLNSPLDACESEDTSGQPEPPADHHNYIWHHLLELGLRSLTPVLFLTSTLLSHPDHSLLCIFLCCGWSGCDLSGHSMLHV